MTPTRRTVTFRIDDELIDGLQRVWERDRVTVSEQIRWAVQEWLEKRGVTVKTAKPARRKRAGKA